ncbi:DUF2339 domain-containing protein [Paenibacillus sp. GSMTC-2017]|uniref:DUF2339 domain-containing protein n=1 Tax=Paenibacillus sp. GSMTC-2017 TaxID=2794350 RepID=UPI0018DA070C|nr:DUF2339 domain-containing protein [Paenibacillus sp. GSMTC-2017]MBH5316936.1 DUF2339 domain-containing protein [Paenibacillus sp. GSMTC-2017]
MKNVLQKHWTSLLGAVFIVAAVITLFQYTIGMGWMTDLMKISLGLFSGATVSYIGIRFLQRKPNEPTGEIIFGIGACILYTTFTFAGIYYSLWEPIVVTLGMIVITIGIAYYAHQCQSRLLMNIALAGGMLAPLMLQPESDQVFTLFLYLLVLNSAFVYLSIIKHWIELRIVSFIGTWLMFVVYYIHFDPFVRGLESISIRYAIAIFLFFTLSMLVTAWKRKQNIDGVDLYLNIPNGIIFGLWSLWILFDEVDFGYVLLFYGVVYMLSGFSIYKLGERVTVASMLFGVAGLVLSLLSIQSFGEGVLFTVITWCVYAYILTAVGYVKKSVIATIAAVLIWFYVGVYWYAITWTSPRGEWFGTYIPFLNWGAFAWIMFAALGFYFSKGLQMQGMSNKAKRNLSRTFALLSHFIVGGLMARQIQNVFTEYLQEVPDVYMDLTLSVVWALYAVILVLWGAYYNERTFRYFGSVVLILVAIKAIFMDLSGEDALFKVLILLILGAISFLITWINGKWKHTEPQSQLQPQPQQADLPVMNE